MDILVFKTNIDSRKAGTKVERSLTQLKGISSWSIDFGDRDKVLRVEADSVGPAEIVKSISSAGFRCEELV